MAAVVWASSRRGGGTPGARGQELRACGAVPARLTSCRTYGKRAPRAPLFVCLTRGGEPHLAIENKNKAPRTRVNRQIRINPLRVIHPDGEQHGEMTVEEPLTSAQQR